MVTERFQPPPEPSVPGRAPWEDVKFLAQKIDRLVTLMETQMVGAQMAPAVPGVTPTILFPGVPPTQQLVLLLQELVPGSIGSSAIIPFQKTVETAYQDEEERMVPYNGVIRDVIMGFPAGCHQLVEVRLVYLPKGGGRKHIVPTLADTFVALDDFTVLFQPKYPVKAPGNLRVEWYNYDSLNTHTVPVIATIAPTGLEVK